MILESIHQSLGYEMPMTDEILLKFHEGHEKIIIVHHIVIIKPLKMHFQAADLTKPTANKFGT